MMKSRRIVHPDRRKGEYIIGFREKVRPEYVRSIFIAFKIRKIKPIGGNLFLIILDRDPGLQKLKKHAAEYNKIKFIELNHVRKINPAGSS